MDTDIYHKLYDFVAIGKYDYFRDSVDFALQKSDKTIMSSDIR